MSTKHAVDKDEVVEPSTPPAPDTVAEPFEELKAALLQAEEKAAQSWDGYVRATAELENLRKRSERDLENAHKYALERFLRELLPVKDSLEAGTTAAEDSIGNLREGLGMTLKLLATVLERFGVSGIDPVKGADFDPELHDAMTLQPSTEVKPGTILQTVQKGYQLGDRLLRPARVIVAKAPDAAA